jgi:putative endopeptidase
MPTHPLATALLCVAALSAGIPGHAESGVDMNVHPGDNFFAYANGAWLASTEIPAGSARWNARNEISELTRRQAELLITSAAGAPAGTDARKLADFHAAYLNEAAIDAAGMNPFRPIFDRIDAVRDKAMLTLLLGSELRADVDPLNWGIYNSSSLIGLAVGSGTHNEDSYVAFLLQGGLGLPTREHYLDPSREMQALRAEYQKRIARVLELVGYDRSEDRAEAVMALETAIAQSHASHEASSDERNADNLWTRTDFSRWAPGMDWAAFFTAAGLSKQESFVVWQPCAITGAAKLVSSYPLDTWRDYLRFHSIDRNAEVLPGSFARPVSLEPPRMPRTQRALQITQQQMSGPLGRLYSEQYFPPSQKARVQVIANNVIAAFRERVSAVSWLSAASKQQALTKLATLYFGVAYPEEWPNYSTLTIDPMDAFGNLRRVADWNYSHTLGHIGQRDRHTGWSITPQSASAFLLFNQNAYNFSAALLQPPKFDPTASEAMNYGAIGAIVGHEVSHFVDTLGADYEANGRKVRWWTAADFANYESVVDPLVRQFSMYRPFPDLAVDGKLTLVENVADLAGLASAFDAYRRTLGPKVNEKEYVRQQDRQFFIGFARAWRAKYHDDGLRKLLTSDGHAPETYRVATVRNLDAWYDAFGVRPGHRLYLDPKLRVRIW